MCIWMESKINKILYKHFQKAAKFLNAYTYSLLF